MRFARVNGFRVTSVKPHEEATSWQEIKKQMLEAKKKSVEPEVNERDNSKENEDKPEISWAEIEEKTPKKLKKPSQLETNKIRKRNGSEHIEEETEDTVNSSKNTPKKLKAKNKIQKQSIQNPTKTQGKCFTASIGKIKVELRKFHGYSVLKEDWERLRELEKSLYKQKHSKEEVHKVLKLQRRRAEKALVKLKNRVCFKCREAGHVVSECPAFENNSNKEDMPDTVNSGICFKCGSSEHTHSECKTVKSDDYKFARCFVCQEEGHISRQCPDNPRGLYPRGGGCRNCGEVTHYKKDCPQQQKEAADTAITLPTMDDDRVEALETERKPVVLKRKSPGKKVVKF